MNAMDLILLGVYVGVPCFLLGVGWLILQVVLSVSRWWQERKDRNWQRRGTPTW